MLDKLGQEIKPGSIIAYGHALGRCAGLRIGKVLKTEIKPPERYHSSQSLRIRITVRGVDDDWSHKEAELTSKSGTLMFPDRIIVLDPATLPDKFMRLLNTVPVIEAL